MPCVTASTCLDVSLPATLASPRLARDRVGELLGQVTTSPRLRNDVRLCVSEAVSNVVRHAYRTDEGTVTLVVARVDGMLRVTVGEAGVGSRGPPHEATRGFGFEIIRRLATRVSVVSAPGRGTEIVMSFARPCESPSCALPLVAPGVGRDCKPSRGTRLLRHDDE